MVRLFPCGFLSLVLALNLTRAGLSTWRIGLLFSLTLAGMIVVPAFPGHLSFIALGDFNPRMRQGNIGQRAGGEIQYLRECSYERSCPKNNP